MDGYSLGHFWTPKHFERVMDDIFGWHGPSNWTGFEKLRHLTPLLTIAELLEKCVGISRDRNSQLLIQPAV